ncbi:hypothetical protein GOM46_07895 [Streptococcus infantis]|uniref:DUF5683 domain-containing protein n=1 Tax=Streptococcus infantis TaxID=68892 RepID=UPI001F36C596|nr:DUF5683 domain-containing protein [Streptococcus infantis]UJD04481.1 hypothetical protein GOM46_07895 [Streptococcus infantis]
MEQQPKKAALLSLIPGLGQIYNKQKAKGFIFLAVTVAFVLYFIVLAAPELSNLITLGEKPGRDNSLFMLIRVHSTLFWNCLPILLYFPIIKRASYTIANVLIMAFLVPIEH